MADTYLWPLIEKHGGKRPDSWRVSVGFPKGSRGGAQHAIGQCFPSEMSATKTREMFISPTLKAEGPGGAVATLAHELIHAALPPTVGHKAAFKTIAVAIGLTGKMTATVGGEALVNEINVWIRKLGEYPHGVLTPAANAKKPGSRLLKLECPGCGYVLRTTAKWLLMGVPTCCCGEEFRGDDAPDEE
jgi:hypothetical protein